MPTKESSIRSYFTKNEKYSNIRSPQSTAILNFGDASMIYRSTIPGLISTDRVLGQQTDNFDALTLARLESFVRGPLVKVGSGN